MVSVYQQIALQPNTRNLFEVETANFKHTELYMQELISYCWQFRRLPSVRTVTGFHLKCQGFISHVMQRLGQGQSQVTSRGHRTVPWELKI